MGRNESEPVGWTLLHQAHMDRKRVAVCASAATITYNQHGSIGPQPAGDWVGDVVEMNGGQEGTFTLAGWSFRTVIRWADVLGAWLRDESPNPCICGNAYEDEPYRLPAAASPGEESS